MPAVALILVGTVVAFVIAGVLHVHYGSGVALLWCTGWFVIAYVSALLRGSGDASQPGRKPDPNVDFDWFHERELRPGRSSTNVREILDTSDRYGPHHH
jgi:hypothetical protein